MRLISTLRNKVKIGLFTIIAISTTLGGCLLGSSQLVIINGTISGLTGSGLVLQDNGGDNLAVPAGSTSFSFVTALSNGSSYNVSVLTQPSAPLQMCTVSNGTGITGTAVNPITITCAGTELVYVTNGASNNVSAYTINPPTGALTSIGTFPAGTTPTRLPLLPLAIFPLCDEWRLQ